MPKLTVDDAQRIHDIETDMSLNLQQKADKITEVFSNVGSDVRVVVAAGKVPRLRFIIAARRTRGASADTSVPG